MSLKEMYKRPIEKGIPLYIMGVPGSGKTAIIKELSKDMNMHFEQLILSQRDSTEVIGVPIRTEIEINEQKFTVCDYAYPKWAIMANTRPTLILLDEYNRAPLDVRNASMQMLNEHRLGDLKFNENVHFVLAGNLGEEDGTDIEELDAAQINRLLIMKHDLRFQEWKENFAEKNLNPFIMEFLDARPEMLYKTDKSDSKEFKVSNYAYASPRSWTKLSQLIGKDASLEETLNVSIQYGAGLIGLAVEALRAFLLEKKHFTLQDVLNKYPEIKKGKINRSKVSEIIREIQNEDFDLNKLKVPQVNNLIAFMKDCDRDEVFIILKNLASRFIEVDFDDKGNVTLSKKARQLERISIEFEEEKKIMKEELARKIKAEQEESK